MTRWERDALTALAIRPRTCAELARALLVGERRARQIREALREAGLVAPLDRRLHLTARSGTCTARGTGTPGATTDPNGARKAPAPTRLTGPARPLPMGDAPGDGA